MGEQRMATIEKILHRIEERVEEWRTQDRARKAEAAAQREKLLAEAIADEESGRTSIEEITKHHRVVFVVHSEEVARTLEAFAGAKDRLVKVVPGKGTYGGGTGVKGSWLVFETSGQQRDVLAG